MEVRPNGRSRASTDTNAMLVSDDPLLAAAAYVGSYSIMCEWFIYSNKIVCFLIHCIPKTVTAMGNSLVDKIVTHKS